MKTAIIYESLYGNTHAIADAIAQGLAAGGPGLRAREWGQTLGTALSQTP